MRRILRSVADAIFITALIVVGLYIGYRLKVFSYPVNSAKGFVVSIAYLMLGLYVLLFSIILAVRIIVSKIQLLRAVRDGSVHSNTCCEALPMHDG